MTGQCLEIAHAAMGNFISPLKNTWIDCVYWLIRQKSSFIIMSHISGLFPGIYKKVR